MIPVSMPIQRPRRDLNARPLSYEPVAEQKSFSPARSSSDKKFCPLFTSAAGRRKVLYPI